MLAGDISAMYMGHIADASPTPIPPIILYMLNATRIWSDGWPYGMIPLSGLQEPMADIRNSIPATSRDFFLPKEDASTPDIAPPIMHPMSALEAVNP